MAASGPGPAGLGGRVLGHYRIMEKIGAGGMGEVYRARDLRLERDVALKILPAGTLADEAARKRFRKEALALSKLNHPNIETVHDFDTQEGMDFLVMEYIPGRTLEAVLAAPLPEREILRLGEQMAEGLGAAHAQGVVHRDLKPGNLRVTPEGRLKILDFGLAKMAREPGPTVATESLSRTEGAVGTLPYMAPEQLLSEKVDARTDLWAAGAVLYEMTARQRAFPDSGPRLVDAILHEAPTPPSGMGHRVSPALEAVILKCLEKDPSNRYQSAKELEVDLRRLSLPPSLAQAAPPRKRFSRRAWMAATGVAVLLVAVLLVGLDVGGLRSRLRPQPAAPQIQSLAVLPLANLSHDPEQDYFADGMTEALITDLSKISALKVISRTSVMRYKGSSKPLPEIARELNVDGVIEGSVLRVGDRVRITAQLIYAPSDTHLWAESYERDLRDVLGLQEEVATAIAEQVRVVVTPQERQRLVVGRSVNPEAYQAYLKGRHYWSQRNEKSIRQGMEQFQRAIALDPAYAPAHAGLADSYIVLAGNTWMSPGEAGPLAKAEARQALALDENLGEAHTSLASASATFDWDFATAEKEFRRAIELNPGYATTHQWYAESLVDMGRMPEALVEARKAQELDPLSPIVNGAAGVVLSMNNQPEAAIREHKKVLEMYPDFAWGHASLGLALWQAGRREESVAELQEACRLASYRGRFEPYLAWVLAQSGRRSEALRLVHQLESQPGYVAPHALAIAYAGLGDKERALALLEKAYQERDVDLPFYLRMSLLDSLRSDPRFLALTRRIGVPP